MYLLLAILKRSVVVLGLDVLVVTKQDVKGTIANTFVKEQIKNTNLLFVIKINI